MASLNVNGQSVEVEADESTPLLWVIRERCGLTGTKYGCGVAQCGACTVHIDGTATRSCPAAARPRSNRARRSSPSRACRRTHRTRCSAPGSSSTCRNADTARPGMIMAAAALLEQKPSPTDADIDSAITNICRCGTYRRVRRAIKLAAGNDDAIRQG